MTMNLSGSVKRILENRVIWFLLLIGNIIGTIIGIYNYWLQLTNSPLHLLLFIPDCPTYTALFCVFLVTYRYKRDYPVLNLFLFTGLIKYAFTAWSSTVLYAGQYTPPLLLMNQILALAHVGMIVDAVLIVPSLKKVPLKFVVLNLVWLFSNDFSDLFLGTFPYTPSGDFLQVIIMQNMLMNIILTGVFLWILRRR